MKTLILGLLTLVSINAFAESSSAVVSYDCEVDATLRFAGRKVLVDGRSCNDTTTEGSEAHLSQRFVFNRVASAKTKLTATNNLIKQCQDLITPFNDQGVFTYNCSDKARTMKAMDLEIGKVSRELVVDASLTIAPELPATSEERAISSYEFCRNVIKKVIVCEEVKEIVSPN